ncbi:MAG TPA: hypothetical protein VL442_09370 [Mucilaginibacter sp.]|nr:hypothetical protein [Mucilaginibacter sp.]
MRPTFFLIVFMLLGFKVFGQAVSIKALADTLTLGQNRAYLTSKDFVFCAECLGEDTPMIYIKNKNEDFEEVLSFYKSSFEYSSKNITFINTLLEQAKAQLRLTATHHEDDAGTEHVSLTSYQFTNGKTHFSFIVFKNGGVISVGAEK